MQVPIYTWEIGPATKLNSSSKGMLYSIKIYNNEIKYSVVLKLTFILSESWIIQGSRVIMMPLEHHPNICESLNFYLGN